MSELIRDIEKVLARHKREAGVGVAKIMHPGASNACSGNKRDPHARVPVAIIANGEHQIIMVDGAAPLAKIRKYQHHPRYRIDYSRKSILRFLNDNGFPVEVDIAPPKREGFADTCPCCGKKLDKTRADWIKHQSRLTQEEIKLLLGKRAGD